MSLDEQLDELRQIVAPLFDEERAPTLSHRELTALKGDLTYLLGSLNSVGLHEKLTASEERQKEIQKLLKEAERFSARALTILDKMLDEPERVNLPSKTGTKPKQRQPDEGIDIPPEPRQREYLTVQLEAVQPSNSEPIERIDSPVDSIQMELSQREKNRK